MKSVLVLNAGSSSLKFALFPIDGELAENPVISGQVDGIGATPELTVKTAAGKVREAVPVTSPLLEQQHRDALTHVFAWLKAHHPGLDVIAAGHRVVHGGERYSAPVVLTPGTLADLATFIPLAPLHQPHNLRAAHAVAELMPSIGQVGCFDTAFHMTQPDVAKAFALPRALSSEGIKRYGFHGLSYDYVARAMGEVIGDLARGSVVICHLGNGSSMTALRDGKSMATTMGFTAIDGLMMGTRTGTLDPGVILYLMQQKGMDARALEKLVYKESGLLGVSGISQDMRTLLASDAPEAAEAVDLYCYRIAREIGSLAVAAGGLDAVVFTGGIGENAAPIRAKVGALSSWAGVTIDAAANDRHASRIDGPDSRVAVAVLPTNEERMIAMYTVEKLGL